MEQNESSMQQEQTYFESHLNIGTANDFMIDSHDQKHPLEDVIPIQFKTVKRKKKYVKRFRESIS